MEPDLTTILLISAILAIALLVGVYTYHKFISKSSSIALSFNEWIVSTVLKGGTNNSNEARLADIKEIYLELYTKLSTGNVKHLLDDSDLRSLLNSILSIYGKYSKTVVYDVHEYMHIYYKYRVSKAVHTKRLSRRKFMKDIKMIFLPEIQRYIETNK